MGLVSISHLGRLVEGVADARRRHIFQWLAFRGHCTGTLAGQSVRLRGLHREHLLDVIPQPQHHRTGSLALIR